MFILDTSQNSKYEWKHQENIKHKTHIYYIYVY